MTLQVVRPEEAAEALRTLMRYIEQAEEINRHEKMPTEKLTEEELRELDEAEREMDEGKSLTLAEFNQSFRSKIHRDGSS